MLILLKYIQFGSIKKTLIIPQGAILLWSWRARKIIIHKLNTHKEGEPDKSPLVQQP